MPLPHSPPLVPYQFTILGRILLNQSHRHIHRFSECDVDVSLEDTQESTSEEKEIPKVEAENSKTEIE